MHQQDRSRSEGGYALLFVLLVVAVLLISVTVVIPALRAQDRREQEEELIFRGNQYARAVYLFRNSIGRYPATMKELLQTNNIRFLRREFKDPMTKSGQWRLIHVGPMGTLTDSKDAPGSNPSGSNPPLPGALGSAVTSPADSSVGQPPFSRPVFIPSEYASAQFGFGGQPAVFSESPASDSQAGPAKKPAGDETGDSDQSGTPEQGGQDQAAQLGSAAEDSSSSSESGDGQASGGFIAGVASTSRHSSIRVWNGKRRYDEWEFVGVFSGPSLLPDTTPSPQQGGAPGAPSPFQGSQPQP
jgi:type II secretory pathway pseudopilin PulG